MIKRKININAVDISIWIIVLLKKKETGLLPYGYCLGGVLVSFFIKNIVVDLKTACYINLYIFIIRNEALVHVLFITVNLTE